MGLSIARTVLPHVPRLSGLVPKQAQIDLGRPARFETLPGIGDREVGVVTSHDGGYTELDVSIEKVLLDE